MLLAVNANSSFKEPCKGCTKSVRIFGTGKSRVVGAIKLHVEIYQSYPLSFNLPVLAADVCEHTVCFNWSNHWTSNHTINRLP